MGRQARCLGEFGGWAGEGKLLLETDELIFRGAARWAAPLGELREVVAADGWLVLRHGDDGARFDLGEAAEKWAHAILHPRGLLDKLGVTATSRVAVVGVDDGEFLRKVRERAAEVIVADAAEALGDAVVDLVFYRAEEPEALGTLGALKSRIVQNGGIWVISPKGRKEIADVVVMAAAKANGLVDVKVARFSGTHTALKLVIPRAQRSAAASS